MTDTVKIKTTELTGPALDWAVAKCDCQGELVGTYNCHYSTNWAQGGPIIERENITVSRRYNLWDALIKPEFLSNGTKGVKKECFVSGETYLIAAMRCFVTSRLGDELEIPAELAPEQPRKMKP